MAETPRRRAGATRIYFDSTEVQPPSAASAKLGRIGDPKLLAVVREVQFQLCVPELVVDEIVGRRLRHLKKVHGRLLVDAKEVGGYVPATVEKTLDEDKLWDTFTGETLKQLNQFEVEIIESDTVPLSDLLAMSLARERPFVGKGDDERDPTGFHDAVILLACLRDARATGTELCFFVSEDKDHNAEAVERLAQRYGVRCLLIRSAAELIDFLERIVQARVTQRAEAVVQMATEYMSEQAGVIQAALERMQPIRVADLIGLGTGTLRGVTKLAVAPGSVRAVPRGVRREGMEAAPLVFWFDAVVTALVTEIVETSLPVEQEPIRPGLELPGVVLGTFSVDRFRPVDVEKEITVPMKGTAVAPRFDGTRYVGEPTIEGLEVYRPTTLSEALGTPSKNPFQT